MGEHTVSSFDEELGHIDRLIRDMAARGAAMVGAATTALIASDPGRAAVVVSDDALMDALQRELDERAVTLIARRQPMAQDLRSVVGAIRMAADFERIGDLAKNVAKRVGAVGREPVSKSLALGIEEMSALALSQVSKVADLYVARDAEGLEKLRDEDEKIDIHYTGLFRQLLTYMMEDPRNITACTHLLFCAKNLERIGDHVTNVAENAYFIITGRQLPQSRPRGDETAALIGA